MATLRVLLAAPPAADRADAWVLVDEQGRAIRHGRDPPSRWPVADRREAVLAASAVRLLALDLPPLPPARVEQAVSYALEERLATALDTAVVVAGPQGADGRILALVVARSLSRAIAAHAPPFDRIVAEPQLAQRPPADTWRWYASDGHGFVLAGTGEAFAVGASERGELPVDLKLALEQAARAGRAPVRIDACVAADDTLREAWTRAAGVPFAAGTAWRWDAGDGSPASDLAPVFAREPQPAAATPSRRPSFAFAMTLLVAAGVLHVVATAGTLAWRKLELSRTQAAIVDVARAAGASDAAELARRHAAAKHRAGSAVPQDAWPRLALAAPALAALPTGALRTARWSGGAWTLELGALDDVALAAFEARLRGAGLSGVAARSPSGVRVRIEGDA
jgi:hypothetical protein